jgi:hypothetical protein
MMTKVEQEEVSEGQTATVVEQKILWGNVLLQIFIHLLAIYGLFFESNRVKLMTLIWGRFRLSVRYTPTHVSKDSFYGPNNKHILQQQLCPDVHLSVVLDF